MDKTLERAKRLELDPMPEAPVTPESAPHPPSETPMSGLSGGPSATHDRSRPVLARRKNPVSIRRPPMIPQAEAELLREITEGRRDPLTIDTVERRQLIAVIRGAKGNNGGLIGVREMAAIFRKPTTTIYHDLKVIRRHRGRKAKDLDELLGMLEEGHEENYATARENGDAGLAWAIRSAYVKQIKDLGGIAGQGDHRAVTFEQIGEGLARAGDMLERVLSNPELTGERLPDRRLPGPTADQAEKHAPVDDGDTSEIDDLELHDDGEAAS